MPSFYHEERIALPRDILYEIILDVEAYPEFLPGCLHGTILEKTSHHMVVDLCAGVSCHQKTFRSFVKLTPPSKIEINSNTTPPHSLSLFSSQPFKYLNMEWNLKDLSQNDTLITFSIDFSFHSWLFNKMIHPIFDSACHTFVQAFKERSQTYSAKSHG